ncbi:hypothetical protein FB106_10394 [Synechococcus sp. Ace-Pa]|nr:hypothetical protein FB106_10394 [Synechococcus sp. Ace-Pa]
MDFGIWADFFYFRGIMEVNFLNSCISHMFLFMRCLISLDCPSAARLALLP